jgi:hypothetical protein
MGGRDADVEYEKELAWRTTEMRLELAKREAFKPREVSYEDYVKLREIRPEYIADHLLGSQAIDLGHDPRNVSQLQRMFESLRGQCASLYQGTFAYIAEDVLDLLFDNGFQVISITGHTGGITDSVILWASHLSMLVQLDSSIGCCYDAKHFTEVSKILERLKESYIVAEREIEERRNRISLLTYEDGVGFDSVSFELKIPKFELELHYNDDTLAQHKDVVEVLKGDGKGILLLHGPPGTGKTTYLRYLTGLADKEFIFISNDISKHLIEPNFIQFLLQNQDCILVIEDAEEIMRKREKGKNTAVSALLNIGDGLLSDILGIQIICTFNCDIQEIDEALLRKGRLIANMNFLPLAAEKATQLATVIGRPKKFETAVPVTEVYN